MCLGSGKYREAVGVLLTAAARVYAPEEWADEAKLIQVSPRDHKPQPTLRQALLEYGGSVCGTCIGCRKRGHRDWGSRRCCTRYTRELQTAAVSLQRHLSQLRARAARALSIARCLAPGPSERAGLDEQLGLLFLDQVQLFGLMLNPWQSPE